MVCCLSCQLTAGGPGLIMRIMGDSNTFTSDSPTPLTRDQVRAFDSWAIQDLGIPGSVLMENAGRGCAEIIRDRLLGSRPLRVTVVCGTGNNGGDGFVIARHLVNWGHHVRVILCGHPDRVQGDARDHKIIWERLVGPVEVLGLGKVGGDTLLEEAVAQNELVVDALFGTGLNEPPRDPYIDVIKAMNRAVGTVVAVDIPSGLDCDTGQAWSQAVRANLTVTFVALKKGFLAKQARAFTGDVVVTGIGVEPAFWPARP